MNIYYLFLGQDSRGDQVGEGSMPDGLQITYWISKPNAGNGLCSKAIRKLMDKSFLTENINFLEIQVDRANLVSKRVAAKAGFINFDSYDYEECGTDGLGIMNFISISPLELAM